jgi:hypothetical protein
MSTEPQHPAALAYTLRTLNDLTQTDTVLGRLGSALDVWAGTAAQSWENGERIADMLRDADGRLQTVAEYLDRAREATGHWAAQPDGATP